MNVINHQWRPRATFPGDHPGLQPSVAGAYGILRDVPSRHQANGLIMNGSPLLEEKRSTRSDLNSTMAVALTARQFASPRSAPRARAVAGPIAPTPIGERQ